MRVGNVVAGGAAYGEMSAHYVVVSVTKLRRLIVRGVVLPQPSGLHNTHGGVGQTQDGGRRDVSVAQRDQSGGDECAKGPIRG